MPTRTATVLLSSPPPRDVLRAEYERLATLILGPESATLQRGACVGLHFLDPPMGAIVAIASVTPGDVLIAGTRAPLSPATLDRWESLRMSHEVRALRAAIMRGDSSVISVPATFPSPLEVALDCPRPLARMTLSPLMPSSTEALLSAIASRSPIPGQRLVLVAPDLACLRPRGSWIAAVRAACAIWPDAIVFVGAAGPDAEAKRAEAAWREISRYVREPIHRTMPRSPGPPRSPAAMALVPALHDAAAALASRDPPVPTGILLCGPPGSGKSHLVREMAQRADADLILLTPADLASCYVGRAEKALVGAMAGARASPRGAAIVVLDHFEVLCDDSADDHRDPPGHHHAQHLMSTLLDQMDLNVRMSALVLIVGITNANPGTIDARLTRPGRLEAIVRVWAPDQRLRVRQIAAGLRGRPHELTFAQIAQLACATRGMSRSEIALRINEAALQALVRGIAGGGEPVIGFGDWGVM